MGVGLGTRILYILSTAGSIGGGGLMAYRWITIAALTTILIFGILAYNGRTIHEDSNAWQCETMGNNICGR